MGAPARADDERPIGPGDYGLRLKRAAHECEELREALHLAYEQRDELVVQAYDIAKMPAADIGRYVGTSRVRVMHIIAKAG